ncbi:MULTISPECIES: stage V sporulation protein AC [Anaerotruncus]|uniref:stage V sporulation protein AC n=1 Tax=Anaerotruncus TaxID=244127 RepID=UPI0008300CEC|nr:MULTISPECIES: stage V sporulation protein AC [Anaerotruncus]RGX56935.1 stage V sporulation protein AC [Anaerotruncus sp. AF02-27]
MNMTPEEYDKLAKKASPPSPFLKNVSMAFLFGGLICMLGQVFVMIYQNAGLDKEVAATAASVSLVFLSVLLTGLNIYDDIAKIAGAGTLVPITGFANSMACAAMEFKSEGLILGLGAKMFIIAGPVIVYGTSASIIYGLIIYLFGLY